MTKQNITRQLSFSTISVNIEQIGKDYSITVSGGTHPHVGCVVLAIPRESLKGENQKSCTSSVINMIGHKDEMICKILAENVAVRKEAVTVCSGGFHVDHMNKEQISEVVQAVKEIAEEI